MPPRAAARRTTATASLGRTARCRRGVRGLLAIIIIIIKLNTNSYYYSYDY